MSEVVTVVERVPLVKVGDVIHSMDSESAIWVSKVEGRYMTRVTVIDTKYCTKFLCAWSAMRANSYIKEKRLMRGLVVFVDKIPANLDAIVINFVGDKFAAGKIKTIANMCADTLAGK